jgi:uncharacterized protein (TIGR00730 family)
MTKVQNVCVYCGSSPGSDPVHTAAAYRFGTILAEAGVRLVYGGGGLGLMGTVARAVRNGGGHVTGIIPDFLMAREGILLEVDEQIIVPDMHTRKRLMFERSDAFVALPGGIGTLEELVEILTWAQLGRHTKPILIADIDGFWQPLLDLLSHMTEKGFLKSAFAARYLVATAIEDVLPRLIAASVPKPAADAVPIDRL